MNNEAEANATTTVASSETLEVTKAPQQKRVLTGMGKFAHVPFSSYDHDRETQNDAEREDREHYERVGRLS